MKPPEIPLLGRVIITFVVSILVIFSALGNSLVLCLLNKRRTPSRIVNCCEKQNSSPSSLQVSGVKLGKRSVTYTFLVNLSISDLLHILICAPFTLIADFLLIYWPFGDFFCRLVNYLQGVVVFLCAFTHVIISIDRLTAIRCPIWRRRKLSVRNAQMILCFIWLCAMIIPIPSLIVCKIVTDEYGLTHCQEVWPEDPTDLNWIISANRSNSSYATKEPILPPISTSSHQMNHQDYNVSNQVSLELIYNWLVMLLQYMVPLSVIIVTYSAIVYQVWMSAAPGEGNIQRDKRSRASKKKLIKMVITVASLYAISQLPRHLIYLITMNKPDAFQRDTIIYTWLLCQLSAWSATCYNPIVYIWMSRTFRSGLFEVFNNLCFCFNGCRRIHNKSRQYNTHCDRRRYQRNSQNSHSLHQDCFHSFQTTTHNYISSNNENRKISHDVEDVEADIIDEELSSDQTENIKMKVVK
ncbi:unnamed protein product [Heterobilharzia americana]|nr:unnamed protein product [Heterobilharzia americana]CAH8615815.1 unnamed protein product [Heterobilharzia americana]